MILLVADPGPLRTALERELASRGESVRPAPTSTEDLFDLALGARAIVYLAAPSMLEGRLTPDPDASRMGRVLSASNAPGVTTLVAVFPENDAYEGELEALRRHGVPFVALRCPALFEEIASVLPKRGAIWVPRVGQVRAWAAHSASESIAAAVETDEQGRLLSPACAPVDAMALFREASQYSGRALKVRPAWRWAYLLYRRIQRWLRAREPLTARLAEALVPELALESPRARAALPASS